VSTCWNRQVHPAGPTGWRVFSAGALGEASLYRVASCGGWSVNRRSAAAEQGPRTRRPEAERRSSRAPRKNSTASGTYFIESPVQKGGNSLSNFVDTRFLLRILYPRCWAGAAETSVRQTIVRRRITACIAASSRGRTGSVLRIIHWREWSRHARYVRARCSGDTTSRRARSQPGSRCTPPSDSLQRDDSLRRGVEFCPYFMTRSSRVSARDPVLYLEQGADSRFLR